MLLLFCLYICMSINMYVLNIASRLQYYYALESSLFCIKVLLVLVSPRVCNVGEIGSCWEVEDRIFWMCLWNLVLR